MISACLPACLHVQLLVQAVLDFESSGMSIYNLDIDIMLVGSAALSMGSVSVRRYMYTGTRYTPVSTHHDAVTDGLPQRRSCSIFPGAPIH